jgi:tRNA(Ile)-lysidine synthase
MALQERVRETIERYGLISSGDKILVAVSGGPDSVALLHLLLELRKELNVHLEVAHLEHGIRGEEAHQDAEFVAQMADGLNLPFHLKRVSLPAMKSEKNKGNLEQMGREERYGFLATTAEERGIARVATGHTRDDQVETFFMWLLRGSGRRGLGGMPPIRPLTQQGAAKAVVIRPLMEISRDEVIGYLTSHGLTYRTDRTNLDSYPLRNWIRLHFLPQIRERFGSHLNERLARQIDVLRDEEAFLDRVARERLPRLLEGKTLMIGPLLEESSAMQRRLFRLWLGEILGNLQAIGSEHVEKAISFIRQATPQGRLSIPRGCELVKQYDRLRLTKKKALQKTVSYSYTFQPGQELVIAEARATILSSHCLWSPDILPESDLEAIFDVNSLPETLTVRNFRSGDRFQPLGMKGHKKVKDLFIEKKVPLSVRRALPLLVAGAEILWIPGYGRSEVGKIGPSTTKILRLKLGISESQFAAQEH